MLEEVTRWLSVLRLDQYISDTKYTVYLDRIQVAYTYLLYNPFTNSYFLEKREAMWTSRTRWKGGKVERHQRCSCPRYFDGGEWLGGK